QFRADPIGDHLGGYQLQYCRNAHGHYGRVGGALVGRKRLYLASFVLFTVGSILVGTAQTFTQMLCYRVIQGLGGGSLVPLSQAIWTLPEKSHGLHRHSQLFLR
ncbi:MAG TPA: MFS transporter, partial [Candidatus Saccharimonadia bacterium]|nr:MFS transporter [Candidatus Saccharimonadia bacterium]